MIREEQAGDEQFRRRHAQMLRNEVPALDCWLCGALVINGVCTACGGKCAGCGEVLDANGRCNNDECDVAREQETDELYARDPMLEPMRVRQIVGERRQQEL